MIPHRWCAISGSCFRFIALHCIQLRYVTLRYFTLLYFTLYTYNTLLMLVQCRLYTLHTVVICDGLFHSNSTPNIPRCDLSSASTFVRDQLVSRLIAAKLKLKFAANNQLNSWCCPTPTSTSTSTSTYNQHQHITSINI